MSRFSFSITDELLTQLQELEGIQRSRAQNIPEELAEREIWKRLESEDRPMEYILPSGRRVRNKAAIEEDIAAKFLSSAIQLQERIDELEQDLRQLRAKQSNELRKALSGVTFFICHASSDKDQVARPLAELLVDLGVSVWYDEYSMRVGDAIRQTIDRGLASARFGIVIVSSASLEKWWPNYELDGLFSKESIDGRPLILPVWHDVTFAEVAKVSPSLGGGRRPLHQVGCQKLQLPCLRRRPNIKIQRAGPSMLNETRKLVPAADLERSSDRQAPQVSGGRATTVIEQAS